MSYEVRITDLETGAPVYFDQVKVCMLSTVNMDIHVEARCFFKPEELASPFLAGVVVAADGLVEQLFDDIEGLRELCDECRDFCLDKEGSDNG